MRHRPDTTANPTRSRPGGHAWAPTAARSTTNEAATEGGRTMKRGALATLALVGVLALALVAGQAHAAPAATKDTQLVGTGATFPFPLISKWIPEVGKAYGINITYSPTGSGAGIAAITARTVDFGASDAPLSDQQLADCKGCVVIPWALSASSIPYNLPGVNGRVHLERRDAREHLPRRRSRTGTTRRSRSSTRSSTCRTRRSRPSTARTARARRTPSRTTCRRSARRGRAASASTRASTARPASARAAARASPES